MVCSYRISVFFPHEVNTPYNYDMIVMSLADPKIMKDVSTRIKTSVDHFLPKTKTMLFHFKMSSVFKNCYDIHVVHMYEAQF